MVGQLLLEYVMVPKRLEIVQGPPVCIGACLLVVEDSTGLVLWSSEIELGKCIELEVPSTKVFGEVTFRNNLATIISG